MQQCRGVLLPLSTWRPLSRAVMATAPHTFPADTIPQLRTSTTTTVDEYAPLSSQEEVSIRSLRALCCPCAKRSNRIASHACTTDRLSPRICPLRMHVNSSDAVTRCSSVRVHEKRERERPPAVSMSTPLKVQEAARIIAPAPVSAQRVAVQIE